MGSWATAAQLVESSSTQDNRPPTPLNNKTLRQVIFPTFSGTKVRIEISNEYGDSPLELKAVHLAKAGNDGAIDTSTDVAVTFGGSGMTSIPAGMKAYSDGVDFPLTALQKVAISIAFGAVPNDTLLTGHPGSRQDSYIQTGDATATANLSSATKTQHWYFLTKLETQTTDPKAGAIVCLGDSITDGRGSFAADVNAPDVPNLDRRWPDYLARRLQADAATRSISVLNLGIGGNTVLADGLGPTATARFDRDVLGQSNVKWLIILEGINDVTSATSDITPQLSAAFESFITKAHGANIKVFGVPLLPFGNSSGATATPVTVHTNFNAWIRTSDKFDAVIDLEDVVKDPAHPTQLNPAFLYQNDYLHLNALGLEAMADAIDLSLFQ